VTHSKHSTGTTTPVRDLASHEKRYLTTSDLANYWGVSRRHIHKQIEQGDLPAVKLGPRSIRVSTQDALDFERRRTVAGGERSDAEQPAPEPTQKPPARDGTPPRGDHEL
jgi:excisionase family DNA binding protein